MDSSELSSPLSSIASDDIEPVPPLVLNGPPSDLDISSLESVSSTPPKRRREPSPPHEVVLADNPDIAVRLWRVHHVPNACLRLSRIPHDSNIG